MMELSDEELWAIGHDNQLGATQAAGKTLEQMRDGAKYAQRYVRSQPQPAAHHGERERYLRSVDLAANLVLACIDDVEQARQMQAGADLQAHLWLRLGMAQQALYFLAKAGLSKSQRARANKARQTQAVTAKNRDRDMRMLDWWDVRPHLKASAVAQRFKVSESTVRRADKKYPRNS